MRRFVILALALALSGCGPKTIKTAATLNSQFAKALVTTQGVVKQAYENGAGPLDDYMTVWSPRFEQVGRIGYSLTTAIEAGQNQSAIVQLTKALDVVDTMLTVDLLKLKDNQRVIVQMALNVLKGVLLSFAGALGEPSSIPLPLEVCHVAAY